MKNAGGTYFAVLKIEEAKIRMRPKIIDQVHRRNRGLIASAVVFGVFANLLMLTGPLFMLQVYDRVLAARAEETLLALFLLVVLLFTIYGVL